MDYRAEFERAVEEMEWGDVLCTLQAVVGEMLGHTPNPPHPTPPTPPIPARLGFNTHTQPVEYLSEGYGGCTLHHLGAPHSFEQPIMATPGLNGGQAASIIYQEPLYDRNVMEPGQLYSQAGSYSQGQTTVRFPGSSAASIYHATPPHTYNNAPMVRFPEGMGQNLVPVALLNGPVVYVVPADRVVISNSTASISKKRKHRNQQDDDQPYIKKPPNAFMVFRKEQRPNVVAELKISDNATINSMLGQRWNSLTKEEQAKYYEEAEKERLLHAQRYPDWSSSDNYGKKRKRERRRAPNIAEESASKPEDVTQQAKKLCVTPMQTAVIELSTSPAGVMEAPYMQEGVMETPYTQTGVMEAPYTQTGVMEAPYKQAGVMEAPYTQTGVMEAPYTQTGVKQTSTSLTVLVMEASHAQTAEMGLHRQLW